MSQPTSTRPARRTSKPLEVNPWFGYYVVRDGRNSALFEALAVGRETMTTPGAACGKCGDPKWFRPLVGDYTCFVCSPGTGIRG